MTKNSKRITLPREFPGVHYYDEQEEMAALRVIRGRSPFRYYGASFLAEAESLEKEFAQRLGRSFAQAVSSCTNGLTAAMAAFGIGPGQEVLIPGFMWVATISAVVRAGGIPVLVEIDDSFTMDPQDLRRKITPQSKLIIPVHMCGVPSNMPAIMKIAAEHGIPVLEDCAQANGAKLKGRQVGSFGEAAVFSFQMNKNITAGEGGMVVTDDEQLYWRLNAAHDVGVPWINGIPDQHNENVLWGCGARMNEISAAIIRVQLRKLDQITAGMQASKQRVKKALADIPHLGWRRVDDPDGDSGPFLIVLFEQPEPAQRFASAASERGLVCSCLSDYGLHAYFNIRALGGKRSNSPDGFPWTHPANIPLVRDYQRGALPRTDALLTCSVILPIPSVLTDQQEMEFIEALRQLCQ